jgi:2-polyprenyl-6-methoxyphenol hydroxylase-like FAD-dependent oxidoreductase
MSALRSVLVVGGGIGGLALGIALARRGIEADVAEIKDGHSPLGVGIIQPGNALRALHSIGVAEECVEAGFGIHERRYLGMDGQLLVSGAAAKIAPEPLPAINALPRPSLHRILHAAARRAGANVRMGTTCSYLDEEKERVAVSFENGGSAKYDLVIGADGIRSTLRHSLFGEIEPRYSGYGCWRVTLPRPPEFEYLDTYQGVNGSKAGLVPLTRDTMYMFLVTTEPHNEHKPRERLHEILGAALEGYEGVIGSIRDGLSRDSDIVYAALEEVILPSPWYKGRTLLIGDAAHASLPHMAQGAAMAIEDAVVLADLAAADLPMEERLERFMRRRFDRCRYVQDTSHAMADSQQDYTRETVLRQQEFLAREFPRMWTKNETALAAPI